ncbi:T9SS type A sorting domain-containing protein [Hymenobacter chitinivorans]|uniref:Putative secreted protein (Por secretion system target) n=1 Tax=Hymenobacter chitinivorans DSM 11115 TaxID=1121954 RepID=A0A2M9ASZ7_9BACT|nr:T9SS type A sorting domain-containing protein [Hymenobacter chitinivorans]PJJ48824.1 putative secreted protein (Por secretion system target) [Hymenobacter chitinivorans DSM 11115]
MPTSTQKFFLSVLGLLSVAATNAQAQTAAAKNSSQLMTLLTQKHPITARPGTAARGINATVVRPGQQVGYYWETTTNSWLVSGKEVNTYNSQGLLTQQVDQDSATAVNYGRTLYSYDAQGKETSYTRQNWTNNAWVNAYRSLTTRDSHGNETLYESQDWNGSAWVTTYGTQLVYTYNGSGAITQEIRKELENGVYVNTDRISYTYTNGQLSALLYEEWNNTAWQNDGRILDIVWYDYANNRPASYREQTFIGNSFVDESRYTISWSANGSNVETREVYNINAWFNYRRYTETKDSQGNDQLYTTESWTNNAWKQIEGYRYINVYNSNNNLIRQVEQDFDEVALQYVNYNKSTYSNFQTITLAARNAALEAQSALYPNPANGVVTLEVAGLSKTESATGEVRNALGQLVQNFTVRPQAGKLSTQLDLTGLKSGVYTVRLQTAEGAVVKRVVRN